MADPAQGDDLFFLAGDDGVIYFAKPNLNMKRIFKLIVKNSAAPFRRP
ncbi:hypothetical protein IPF89_03045 [Candidatus Saccharibacteria bacterium]|nr:MAG: hypothetical protein IPF89_03045 [Candidatus Saccharibacteria bacterium]